MPVGGFSVQAAYLLTGETVNDNALIDPLHPFDIRPGRFGLGDFQPTARYSTIYLGKQVFTGGFADPNQWTDHVQLTDVGFNWYLNKWTKIYFDWQHAMFASPVVLSPGKGADHERPVLVPVPVLLLTPPRSRINPRYDALRRNASLGRSAAIVLEPRRRRASEEASPRRAWERESREGREGDDPASIHLRLQRPGQFLEVEQPAGQGRHEGAGDPGSGP